MCARWPNCSDCVEVLGTLVGPVGTCRGWNGPLVTDLRIYRFTPLPPPLLGHPGDAHHRIKLPPVNNLGRWRPARRRAAAGGVWVEWCREPRYMSMPGPRDLRFRFVRHITSQFSTIPPPSACRCAAADHAADMAADTRRNTRHRVAQQLFCLDSEEVPKFLSPTRPQQQQQAHRWCVSPLAQSCAPAGHVGPLGW